MAKYNVGDKVRFTVAITVDATPTDPTDLLFKFRTSEGTITVYTFGVDSEVVKDSFGNYHADIIMVKPTGKCNYKWEATGAAVGAEEREIIISPTQF